MPLFILNSELKKNITLSEARNLKDFLFFYAELLQIKTPNLRSDYRFISEEKAKDAFKLYNNLNYENLSNNPLSGDK